MILPALVDACAQLSSEEISRYSRHLLIPDVGLDGQRRLKSSKVLVIGAGGLGSPTLLYLASARSVSSISTWSRRPTSNAR